MINESKAFTGVLSKFGAKAKDEEILSTFTIKHVEEGEHQNFLDSYAEKCNQPCIIQLFSYPVQWKSINIGANFNFKIEFDEVEIEATLKSIRIARTYKLGIEIFTYQLLFEKEADKEIDAVFQSYLNQKEMGDDGKKRLIEYPVYLTPIEPDAQSLEV